MPCLSNPEHEAAAQHLARKQILDEARLEELRLMPDSSPQEQAAAIGGLDPNGSSFRANARKFCNRPAFKARVHEIQSVGAALAGVTVESLIVETDRALEGALKDREWSAANGCIQTKAKLAGLWRDKRDVDVTVRDANTLTDDELARIAAGGSAGAAQAAPAP